MHFNKGLNILIGENNSGKTAIIDALRICIGYGNLWLYLGISGHQRRALKTYDFMEHREVKFALAALVIIFFSIGVLFRKRISYFFCPLSNYTGKIYKGKSHYLFLLHFFISFGLCIGSYAILNKNERISAMFEDVGIRLLTILGIWIMFFYIVGLSIELYLLKTDEDYRNWKKSDGK